MVARLIGGEVGWWQRGWRRRGGEEVGWDAFKNENPHPVGGGNYNSGCRVMSILLNMSNIMYNII